MSQEYPKSKPIPNARPSTLSVGYAVRQPPPNTMKSGCTRLAGCECDWCVLT